MKICWHRNPTNKMLIMNYLKGFVESLSPSVILIPLHDLTCAPSPRILWMSLLSGCLLIFSERPLFSFLLFLRFSWLVFFNKKGTQLTIYNHYTSVPISLTRFIIINNIFTVNNLRMMYGPETTVNVRNWVTL